MSHIKAIYFLTEMVEVLDNSKEDIEFAANHYQYIYPSLEYNAENKSALYEVIIASQFESESLPYRLITKSKFGFENFHLSEECHEILEDYVQFAYRKHKQVLKERLPNQFYIEKIDSELEEFQYKTSILGVIQNEMLSYS